MSDYVYHTPVGDPCEDCGFEAKQHRVKHREFRPDGSRCTCGATHRSRNANGSRRRSPSQLRARHRRERTYFLGLDGEGQGQAPHRYTLLAGADMEGKKQFFVENMNGLSTIDCLEFLLALPASARAFSYAFFYDLTKILQDLTKTNEGRKVLYELFRPELRRRLAHKKKFGPRAVRWGNYSLNLMGKRFTVRSGKRKRVIWDIFAFFQKRFVATLDDWEIGSPAVRARMQLMKEKRHEFDKLSPKQVRDYCLSECRCMATLAKQNDEAHIAAGIPLRRYDGAGSSASAILRTMQIEDLKVEAPDALRGPVACAFFGGRFEHSVIGAVEGPLYSFDISGAYPYHIHGLPCLVHAKWVHTRQRSRIEKARHALVRYVLHDAGRRLSWGPFPFRELNGTIVFPSRSGGGWVWRDEYLAGERLFPNVQFKEAWCLESDCDCKPFDRMAEYYLRRIQLGADQRGLVLKSGLAACAGKLMQSVGFDPPFQNWIWAGITTSGPRAQFLDALGMHSDPANCLAIATDGIHTREDLAMPPPRDTGTFTALDGTTNPKPLGGWVRKIVHKGVFFAKPGVYFPLRPTKKEIEDVRARGLGRKNVWENWRKVVKAWQERKHAVHLPSVTRFHGAKSSITKVGKDRYEVSPDYGEWSERPIGVTLGAFPKRLRYIPVEGTDYAVMTLRAFPADMMSEPYRNAVKSPEAVLLQAMAEEAREQPEGDDYADYSNEGD